MSHPYKVVTKASKHSSQTGFCEFEVDLDGTGRIEFRNLGIQCVKMKDVTKWLDIKENHNVDPFKSKFALSIFD